MTGQSHDSQDRRSGAAPGGLDCQARPGEMTIVTVPALADIAETCVWLEAARADIRQMLDRHGALYFSGLPMRTAEDFARVRDALVSERVAYREKATPRSSFGDDVFSSTDLPAAQPIRLHNENSYTLTFPGILLFGCLTAPPVGGATPVADVRTVLANLPPRLVERFRQHGWRLVRNYSDHLSLDWRSAFGASSTEEVMRYCAENQIGCEWGPDGRLRTSQLRSAIIRHPRTGDEVWFNHVAFWNAWSLDPDIREVMVAELGEDGLPFHTECGDGELTAEEVAAINDAYDRATVRQPWRPGDVLIVDNVLAAHGRDPFQGDRRIVVAMGEPVRLEDCAPTVPPGSGR